MNITENLERELKIEIGNISKNISSSALDSAMRWVFVEYKNCMIVRREDFENTLDDILDVGCESKPVFQLLKDNIGKYGAPRAFLNVARKHLQEQVK
tara:strand:+ start:233 stop:523 length:291 start_codon:yes stop_codon:yes gene_type:complete